MFRFTANSHIRAAYHHHTTFSIYCWYALNIALEQIRIIPFCHMKITWRIRCYLFGYSRITIITYHLKMSSHDIFTVTFASVNPWRKLSACLLAASLTCGILYLMVARQLPGDAMTSSLFSQMPWSLSRQLLNDSHDCCLCASGLPVQCLKSKLWVKSNSYLLYKLILHTILKVDVVTFERLLQIWTDSYLSC